MISQEKKHTDKIIICLRKFPLEDINLATWEFWK